MPSDDADARFLKTIVVVFVVVFLLWGGAGVLCWMWFGIPDSAGVFGDQFGSINALFSGLAFAGVIVSLFFQKHEIRLQREELTLQREELAKSTEAQQKSSAALEERLRFERDLAQSRLTFDLYEGFQTIDPDNARLRQQIDWVASRGKYFKALAKLPVRERPKFGGLVNVVRFLDKCARLDRRGLIDLQLLDDLLHRSISAASSSLLSLDWDGADDSIAKCITELRETQQRMVDHGENHWT